MNRKIKFNQQLIFYRSILIVFFLGTFFLLGCKSRGKYFDVSAFGSGTIDISGNDRAWSGPIVKVRSHLDSLFVKLDDKSIYAIDTKGDTIKMHYFIPIDLGDHEVSSHAKHVPESGQHLTKQILVLPSNTFTTLNWAFSTANSELYFVINFTNGNDPVTFGILFHSDLGELTEIHILGTIFYKDSFH